MFERMSRPNPLMQLVLVATLLMSCSKNVESSRKVSFEDFKGEACADIVTGNIDGENPETFESFLQNNLTRGDNVALYDFIHRSESVINSCIQAWTEMRQPVYLDELRALPSDEVDKKIKKEQGLLIAKIQKELEEEFSIEYIELNSEGKPTTINKTLNQNKILIENLMNFLEKEPGFRDLFRPRDVSSKEGIPKQTGGIILPDTHGKEIWFKDKY